MALSLRQLWAALLLLALAAPARALAADAKPAADAAGAESGTEEEAGAKKDEKSNTKTLEDRIRPVSGSLFIRKGRSEIEPELGISFNDAFFQKYMFGLKYAYHATDSFSVELGGAFGITTRAARSTPASPTAARRRPRTIWPARRET